VATITVEPITSGWAYTCPVTAGENTSPKPGPCTTEGLSPGSCRSHPVRRLFSEAVPSSPGARGEAVNVLAGRAARTEPAPAAAGPVSAQTEAGRARSWRLEIDGELAWLVTAVDPGAGLRPGYELKLTYYDIGVAT